MSLALSPVDLFTHLLVVGPGFPLFQPLASRRASFALIAHSLLGEHAAPHAAAIARRLEDEDGDVRHVAVEVLDALREHAAPHAAALVTV